MAVTLLIVGAIALIFDIVCALMDVRKEQPGGWIPFPSTVQLLRYVARAVYAIGLLAGLLLLVL